MFDIPAAVSAVSGLADSVVKRIWPDATEIEKAKLDQLKAEMQNEFNTVLGQLDINKAEATSSSVFVSGWRPFIGWVCGASLAYVGLVEPIGRFLATVIFAYTGIFPVIDTNLTMQILMGLLGLGGLRTFEKSKGVAK